MRTCTKTACCLHQVASSVGWDEGTAKMPLARPAEVDGTGPLTLPLYSTGYELQAPHTTSTLGGKRKSETHLLFEHLVLHVGISLEDKRHPVRDVRTGESCSSWRVARIRVGL